jgi:hypothetical protein
MVGSSATEPVSIYGPGSTDVSRVRVQQIRRVDASVSGNAGPGVEIELVSSGGEFYVGGLYWVLWIGDTHAIESRCGPDGRHLCFFFSQAVWNQLPMGAPLRLTWGEGDRERVQPFAQLDKTLLDESYSKMQKC